LKEEERKSQSAMMLQNQSEDQVLISNPGVSFPDFLLDDQYMNQMLCAEEAELMRALGDPVFDTIEEYSGSDDTQSSLDRKLNEKSVVIAAQAAAGLSRGGLKRAAFSMNDLTALQVQQPRANGGSGVKAEKGDGARAKGGRRASKKPSKLKALDENKPLKHEELSTLGTMDNPDLMPDMHYSVHGNQQYQDSQQQQHQVMMPPQQVANAGQWNQQPGQPMNPHGQYPPAMYQHNAAVSQGGRIDHQQAVQMHMPAYDQTGAGPPPGVAGGPVPVPVNGVLAQTDPAAAAAAAAAQANVRSMPMQPHMYRQVPPGQMGHQGVAGQMSKMNGHHPGHGHGHPQYHQPLHPNGMNGHLNGHHPGVNVNVNGTGAPALRRVASSPNFSKMQHLEHAKKAAAAAGGASAAANGEGQKRIGTLTLEERRARILRYRQKRHERNFRKRIKYNCRKTLADSRPRIRGRFARNDEIEELLKQKKLEEQKQQSSGNSSKSSSKSDDNNQASDSDKEVKSC
jgi:hypothetical protein